MKKLFLLLAVAIATLMSVSAQNLITDGTFTTTSAGNFTLTSSVGSTRSVWGGINSNTNDATLPIIGVTTGGATGNCAVYTRGTTSPTWSTVLLYQRLPSTAGLMSPTKSYKVTMKLKSGSTLSDGYFFIRFASSTKLAVREDYSTGQTFAWRKSISSIPNTWTEYSQSFVFSNSITSGTQGATPSGTAFTDNDMTNLYIGFYSTTADGTVYVDDVVFEEDIAVPTANAASDVAINSFTANWSAVSGAASYQLDVSTNNTFTAILSSYNNLSVSGTSQVVTGLSANTAYYYRVRAVSNAGTSTGNSSTITATTLVDPNIIVDGTFTTTATGDFTLGTTGSVNNGIARSIWGGVNTNTGDSPLPIVGVASGGYTGNCASFTPGSTQPSPTVAYLYQRLPNPSNINTGKTYRLTVKLKADAANVKGFLYIKSRPNAIYAVRADYANDNYAWCKYITSIETSWTEYTQTFLFSNSVTSATQAATPTGNAIGTSDLNDLIFGFYSVDGKAYIDDVVLEEYANAPTITGTATATSFTSTYGTTSSKQDFSFTGSNLIADITATAPTGFEVASDGTNFSSTASIAQSLGSASGTISLRLKANAAVSGTYNSQNIIVSSGATVFITTAASGNAVTAASGSLDGGNLSNSGLTDNQLANTNLTISSGEFIINDTKTVLSLSVDPGAKLTHSSGTLTATNGITLESDANGTATLMDSYTEPTIAATIKQYVTAGRNWYMSAPLNNTADYTVLNKGNSVAEYNETTGLWPAVTTGTLTRGKGYVQVASATQGTTGTVSFSGITNSGDVPVTLTYTSDKGKGFNLVGNPYPSYLSWTAVAADNAAANMPTGTMWYRTISYNGKSAWVPNTPYNLNDIVYNGTRFYKVTTAGTSAASGGPSGGLTGITDGSVVWNYEGSIYIFATISASGVATPATVSNLIPPMQAFWVKSTGGTLTFKNAMRSHNTGGTNALKAPKKSFSEMPLVRLSVSNGVSADEAVIYVHADAANGFDNYDAPKYFNTASNQPEIYSKVGNEKLVINAINEISQGTEIPLGFTTEKGNDFTIAASELKNLDSDTKVILEDKQTSTEFDLTTGQSYAFSSDAITESNRFSLIFRISGNTTGTSNTTKRDAQVFVNSQNKITIIAKPNSNYSIYNAVGQLIENGTQIAELQTANCKLQTGLYIVKVNNHSTRVIIK